MKFDLRKWRTERSKTQAEAAEFFGASPRSITSWEKAGESPDWIVTKATEEPVSLAVAFSSATAAMRALGHAIERAKK